MTYSDWDKNRELLAGGEIHLSFDIEPVSLQASRKKKELITSEIQNVTNNFEFILVEDVQVDIQWTTSEQKRYESDSSPDVDNILKPILDAICGPKGILVDDCQIQAISCHWLNYGSESENITINIKMYRNDEWLLKEGLIFVHMGKGLCYPHVLKDIPPDLSLSIVEKLEEKLKLRDEMISKGCTYNQARGIMSLQRIFHISRVQEFPIIELAELKRQLINNNPPL
ncbi:MAG: RusA family crossover junction endodeoxyribonuclease [Nostoc sp. ChiQUE01a]|nr:RusA family crossover junction endodeoxyribonuclease [Nostoc sp. ChiQUE01a]